MKTSALMKDAKERSDKSRFLAVAEDRLLSVHEVAAYLGLSVGGVYHLSAAGKLPCIRLGKRCLRFRLSALHKFVEENSIPARR